MTDSGMIRSGSSEGGVRISGQFFVSGARAADFKKFVEGWDKEVVVHIPKLPTSSSAPLGSDRASLPPPSVAASLHSSSSSAPTSASVPASPTGDLPSSSSASSSSSPAARASEGRQDDAHALAGLTKTSSSANLLAAARPSEESSEVSDHGEVTSKRDYWGAAVAIALVLVLTIFATLGSMNVIPGVRFQATHM